MQLGFRKFTERSEFDAPWCGELTMGSYFIRMDDAPGLRRRILESSKASIHVLRGYQQLLKTRGEKRTMLKALRREMKELTLLVNRLEELMPTLSKAELASMSGEPTKGKKSPRKSTRKTLPKLDEKRVYVGKALPALPKRLPAKPAPKPTPEARALSLQDKLASIEEKLKRI